MFIINKYYSYYYSIINNAKSRRLDLGTYVERHHIIPKSLGGSNDKDNIVALTAREHLICHRLLIKITTGVARRKMATAAWRMAFSCKQHKRHKVSARAYESIKIEVANAARERNKSYKHSDESKEKIAKSKRGKSRTFTSEWIEKLRQANIGKKKKPCTEARKKRISEAKLGAKLGPPTDEHKQKISSAKKGKKLHIDPETGRRYFK